MMNDFQNGDEVIVDCGWPDIAGKRRATVVSVAPYAPAKQAVYPERRTEPSHIIRVRIHLDGSTRDTEFFFCKRVNLLQLIAEAAE